MASAESEPPFGKPLSSGYFSSALKPFAKHAPPWARRRSQGGARSKIDGRNERQRKRRPGEIIYSRVRVRHDRQDALSWQILNENDFPREEKLGDKGPRPRVTTAKREGNEERRLRLTLTPSSPDCPPPFSPRQPRSIHFAGPRKYRKQGNGNFSSWSR